MLCRRPTRSGTKQWGGRTRIHDVQELKQYPDIFWCGIWKRRGRRFNTTNEECCFQFGARPCSGHREWIHAKLAHRIWPGATVRHSGGNVMLWWRFSSLAKEKQVRNDGEWMHHYKSWIATIYIYFFWNVLWLCRASGFYLSDFVMKYGCEQLHRMKNKLVSTQNSHTGSFWWKIHLQYVES